MRQKSKTSKEPAEKVMRDIRCRTRRKHSSEEKIRIVLEGLRGVEGIAALCRREGIAVRLGYGIGEAIAKEEAGLAAAFAVSAEGLAGDLRLLRVFAAARLQSDRCLDKVSRFNIGLMEASRSSAVLKLAGRCPFHAAPCKNKSGTHRPAALLK